jgi:hypothetical protein
MELNEADQFRPEKFFWSPGAGWTEAVFVARFVKRFMIYIYYVLKGTVST